MRFNIVLLGFIFAAGTFLVMAGNDDHGHNHGHDHGSSEPQIVVDEATAKSNATNILALLIERKKIENSWASIVASSVEKKTFNGVPEWIIRFVNDDIADSSKQTLYIFLTINGDYIAANYTGK